MSRDVRVHLLPQLFEPDELCGGIAVVIDVLRASTTICHALAAGAKAVVPCEEIEEARRMAANHSGERTVLGGERGGRPIEGFDLGNSAFEYTEEAVGGRTVVFTTTNGTRALLRCRQAERVLLGTFVNLRAVVRALADDGRPVHVVCAGTDGAVTAEDCLCAGALAADLRKTAGEFDVTDDSAQVAAGFYTSCEDDPERLAEAMRRSAGGRNLAKLGYEADIERAATRDLFDLVPEYAVETGRIEPGRTSQDTN